MTTLAHAFDLRTRRGMYADLLQIVLLGQVVSVDRASHEAQIADLEREIEALDLLIKADEARQPGRVRA
jgi:hypothetical protein